MYVGGNRRWVSLFRFWFRVSHIDGSACFPWLLAYKVPQ